MTGSPVIALRSHSTTLSAYMRFFSGIFRAFCNNTEQNSTSPVKASDDNYWANSPQ